MHTSDFRRFLRIYAVIGMIMFIIWWSYIFFNVKFDERFLEGIALGIPYTAVVSALAALAPAYLIFIISKVVKDARSKKGK